MVDSIHLFTTKYDTTSENYDFEIAVVFAEEKNFFNFSYLMFKFE